MTRSTVESASAKLVSVRLKVVLDGWKHCSVDCIIGKPELEADKSRVTGQDELHEAVVAICVCRVLLHILLTCIGMQVLINGARQRSQKRNLENLPRTNWSESCRTKQQTKQT